MLLKLELGDLPNDILGQSELVAAEHRQHYLWRAVKSQTPGVYVRSPKKNKEVALSWETHSKTSSVEFTSSVSPSVRPLRHNCRHLHLWLPLACFENLPIRSFLQHVHLFSDLPLAFPAVVG